MSTSLVVKVFALPCLHAYVKYIPVYKYIDLVSIFAVLLLTSISYGTWKMEQIQHIYKNNSGFFEKRL